MRLRKLENKDAQYMLEWMHDENVLKGLSNKFDNKTLNDCLEFIEYSKKDKNNLHLAIIDDNDEYMGTVSLKGISNECAEFAIAIRTIAMSKGYSSYAIKEIIRIAFEELKIDSVYWQVLKTNKRAINFYDKNGYKKISFNKLQKYENFSYKCLKNNIDYFWYFVENAKKK